MTEKITERTFYKYLKCPLWVYFDVHDDDDRVHESLMQRLQDDGLLKKKQMELLADRADIAEVTAEDPEEAYRQTLEYMRDGRQTIFHGTLVDGRYVANPDVLEKVQGTSKFGDYYYVSADIKRAFKVRDDHKFQGCFYADLLHRIQDVKPYQGYVINPDGETMAYHIEEFEAEYALTLDKIEEIIAGTRPSHFLTSGCKQSPWFEKCRAFSESCNDLSLLNRVWRTEVKRLADAGIETVDDLAETPVNALMQRVDDVHRNRLEFMHEQAKAIKSGEHIVREPVDLPDADLELHFDIESDPLRDFDYLFGVLVVDGDDTKYHAFYRKDAEDEEEMWEEFVDLIERYSDDVPIYHYGYFEVNVVNRFAAKYGISETARDALSRNMVDLLDRMREAVIFPFPFYSLKDVAKYVGFSWRADDASGANSVLWFEEWLETGDEAILKKILNYNEDDCRATNEVVEWLRKNAVA